MRRRITIFWLNSVGRHETRKSISLRVLSAAKWIFMLPFCGSRFSAMSSRAMILRREVIASRNLIGGAITLKRMPLNRKRNPELLLVGLDVDVARALVNRRHQHQADEADDRGFPALPFQPCHVDLLELVEHLDVVVGEDRGVLERLRNHLTQGGGTRDEGLGGRGLERRRGPPCGGPWCRRSGQ